MTDGMLPYDLVRELQDLRRRLNILETSHKPQISMPIPTVDSVVKNSSGFHATTNTTETILTIGRAPLSARYLHYSIVTNDSLLSGGATTNVGIKLFALPLGITTTVTLTPTTPNLYTGAIDLYQYISETYKGREIRPALVGHRVGGSGSVQIAFDFPLILKAQDFVFYGG